MLASLRGFSASVLISSAVLDVKYLLVTLICAMRNGAKCVFQGELILRSLLEHMPYPTLPYYTLRYPTLPFLGLPFLPRLNR